VSNARLCLSPSLPFYTSKKDTYQTRVQAEALNAEWGAVCK
jgi:hypothetical protein